MSAIQPANTERAGALQEAEGRRALSEDEIDEIVDHVVPRVKSLLAEPFIRYRGTPEEVVDAALEAYQENYRRQRESEAVQNVRSQLEKRKALKDLQAQVDALFSEERVAEIRAAIRMVYDMQMAELEQLRTGLRRDLEQAEAYEAVIEPLKERLWVQYRRAEAVPGTAVGNLATDSISAPAVQLTLDTFHSTGSVMTVDSGLDLLQTILYARRAVKNPIMTIHFDESERVDDGGVVRKERMTFEKILSEKRAELRHLTFFHVIQAETVDTRANIVGAGEKRAPWWYALYNELHHYPADPIPAGEFMMRLELNMNELYLSRVDQFEIARILSKELQGVQIVPSPVLRYPARFSDVYVPEAGDQDADVDPDREVLVPVVYIDILPEKGVQDPDTPFYMSESYRLLSETVANVFHEITIKGIPGITEVQPGHQRVLEVIKEARPTVQDAVDEMAEEAARFHDAKHAGAALAGLRAYDPDDVAAERAKLGFVSAGRDALGDVLHLPPEGARGDEAQLGAPALRPWMLYIDTVGMRMKGFSRAKIEDALEYVGARIVGWVDEPRPMDYVPQADILECLATRDPQKVLQEAINRDEELAIQYSRDQMSRKVRLYKSARFQEANKVAVERRSSILERLCFTVLADVRGYNLEKVWAIPGVDASLTYCSDMHLLFELLGVEAVRNYNQVMLFSALKSAASSMDLRHINLLTDMTTRRGVVDSIKLAGLRQQNIPSVAMAALEDPLGCIVKSASTGEVSSLDSPYAAFLFGQTPSNHAAIPQVSMTPEYEEAYRRARVNRTLGPDEIDEAVWGDMYHSEVVLSEEGKVKRLDGGTVQREENPMPLPATIRSDAPAEDTPHSAPQRAPQGDRMGRIDDWVAPMGAVSTYTAKAMLTIAEDAKRAPDAPPAAGADAKDALQPATSSEEAGPPVQLLFKPFAALEDKDRKLVGEPVVPEGETVHTSLPVPEEAYTVPRFPGKTSLKSILDAL